MSKMITERLGSRQVRLIIASIIGTTILWNSASDSLLAAINSPIGLGASPTTGGLNLRVDGAFTACGGLTTSVLGPTSATGSLLVTLGGKAVWSTSAAFKWHFFLIESSAAAPSLRHRSSFSAFMISA